MNHAVRNGIITGALLAFIQASISVAMLRWAWRGSSFYKVWAVGILSRFVVFGMTAFIVVRYTSLNLAATMLTLAVATMVVMILEIFKFLTPK